MKRNLYYGILVIEAAICIALTFVQASFSGVFSTVIAFPFEQIGIGLRALSLSSGLGNAAAIVIYAAAGLSPVMVLLYLRARRKLLPEDGLLVLLSIMLFVNLYFMINPGIIGAQVGGQISGKMILGGAVYSVLCGFCVLRALRLFFKSDAKRLAGYMSVMLGILGMIFVYLAFGFCLRSLIASIEELRAGNTGNEHLLLPSYVFLGLGFLVDMIPYVLDIIVVRASLRLLEEFRTDRYSEKAVTATGQMSRLCTVSLVATVILSIAFNVLQCIFVNALRVINVTVSIPVFSIAFVLAALLLTRFVAENKRLKDENDTFI